MKQTPRAPDELFQDLQVTFDGLGEAFIAISPDGKVRSLNATAQKLLRVAEVDALGRPFAEILPLSDPKTFASLADPASRALAEGAVVPIRGSAGSETAGDPVLIVEGAAAPIQQGGTTTGAIVVFRDATDGRIAQQERHRLAAVVDSSDDAIVSKTQQGIITSWNAGAERIFGYPAREVVGKSIAILIPTERLHEESEILEQIARGQRIDHFETVRVRRDGRRIHVSVTVSPIKDAAGNIIGVSKIARDISSRTHARQTAQFLADTSNILAERRSPDAILEAVVRAAVPAFADWAAVYLESPVGPQTFAKASAPEVSPQLGTKLGDWVRERQGPLSVTEVLSSGVAIWIADFAAVEALKERATEGLVSYIAVPLTVRGVRVGVLAFAAGTSGRMYDEMDFQTAKDLAHRVAVALENERLLEALRESDKRKDEFLAVLSHELRNPLAPIRNAAQLLQSDPSPARAEWASRLIERQVAQMTRLVDDLLDVARISRGEMHLRKEPALLSDIVARAVDAIAPAIESAHQTLSIDQPEASPTILVDRVRLTQVLINLLDNASKYSQRNGLVALHVACDKEEIRMRVTDSGIGISRAMLPKIFEMFVQADTSLERAHAGLGIGLTLVQRIVALHGGTVSAHSEGEGRGSEFLVRLPLELGQAASAKGPSTDPSSVGGSRRVLVIDDNRDSAESLSLLMKSLGHAVQTAHDGLDGLAVAEEFQPDIAFIDIGLPSLNGYEVGRRLRAQRGRGITLIAVTGWGQMEDRRQSTAAGFDHHLTKPVDFNVVKQLVPRVPKRRSSEAVGGA